MSKDSKKPTGKIGRPRVLDEGKRREICALVSAGVSIKNAAQYIGCAANTIRRELDRDEEFAARFSRARAMLQLGPLQAMRQAAQSNWRAAAWMLERADPDQFGRRQPQALGAKEIRALGRDLLDIFDKAVDDPMKRKHVLESVKATINYALRHAWDTRRTGSQLRQAMEFLDRRRTASNELDEIDLLLNKQSF